MAKQAFNFAPQTQAERDIYELYEMVIPNSKDHWDIMPDEVTIELSCRGCHSGEFLGLIFNAPPYMYRLILVPDFMIEDGHFALKLSWQEFTDHIPKFSGASDAARRHVATCTYEDKPHLFRGEQTLRHFKRRITIILSKTEDGKSYVLKDPDCLDWLVCDRAPEAPKESVVVQQVPVWQKPPVPEQDKQVYVGPKALDEMQRQVLETIPLKNVLEYLQAIAKADKMSFVVTPKKIRVGRQKVVVEDVSLEDL